MRSDATGGRLGHSGSTSPGPPQGDLSERPGERPPSLGSFWHQSTDDSPPSRERDPLTLLTRDALNAAELEPARRDDGARPAESSDFEAMDGTSHEPSAPCRVRRIDG